MNTQAPHSEISFERETTLKWPVSAGDYVLWLRWKDLFASAATVDILDFWAMKAGDKVTLTNRIEDLPPWFELHPTEASGSVAYRMMQKLKSGYVPLDPVDGPNLWRVLTGDRMLWLRGCGSGTPTAHRIQALLDFRANALAFGESGEHAQDLASFLSFGAPANAVPSKEVATLFLAGLTAVKELGPPREMEVGNWTLG